MKERFLLWLAGLFPEQLLLALLLYKVWPGEVHRIALAKVVDETGRAHFSADSLAMPALVPKREDALRRMRRLLPDAQAGDVILGLELQHRQQKEQR